MWGNELFQSLYDNLLEAYSSGEDYIKNKAQEVANSAVASVEWIWEALQGDFNENLTTGQIAANAVLGLIPVVDQVLDCRDVIANCKQIHKDKSDIGAWIALCLTLIGLIPTLGSAVKGVLKILFLYIRRAGNDVGIVVRLALKPIFSFLNDPKVKGIIGNKSSKDVMLIVAVQLRELASSINAQQLISLFDNIISVIGSCINKIKPFAPDNVVLSLNYSFSIVKNIRDSAQKPISDILEQVKSLLRRSADEVENEVNQLPTSFKGLPNGAVVHQLDESVAAIDPKFIRMTNAQKGLYGEIISDNFMLNRRFKNMLPEDRQVRTMADKPRGRGIDGIYENLAPPPPFVITETKYRTESGKFIDDDGLAKDSVLSMTKHSGKQMSDEWVEKRLADELSASDLRKIRVQGYDKWLMIVDDSGKVVNVTKLDADANAVKQIL
ncbi:hypothetical protein ID062_09575 [Vibrio cholerae]|uniref:hypothetical protein n=1 Tax=Vibrio cholerae TaxID=666 RepID=UPI00372CDF8B